MHLSTSLTSNILLGFANEPSETWGVLNEPYHNRNLFRFLLSAVAQIRLRDRHFPPSKTDLIGHAVLNFCLKHTHVSGSLESEASDEHFLRAVFVVGTPIHANFFHLGIGVMSFGFKNVDQQRIDANIMASHVQA